MRCPGSAGLLLLLALASSCLHAAADAPKMAPADAPPYPPSPVIRSVTFDPVQTVKRDAPGSDNWPITWGDDDQMYTSYGDGWGFAPRTEKKLSLGLARVEGGPDRFKGINLRSPSAERTGDGKKGPKASGLLMVEGTLYMWVRNTGNSTLAWSEDRGRTWTWGFTFDTSFGCPAFLNFGPNYAGARDEYVYTYSQDGPGAYEPYDGIVLARVKKEKIRQRSAYEFFAADGWSRDVSKRRPVFRYPGHCERLDVVYHPAIKRYLLALSYGHGQGWGLFDAPEPWGPWTTAFHTTAWDIPGVHGFRLPAKWIAADGKMSLIFSGLQDYDAFCVRGMRLGF